MIPRRAYKYNFIDKVKKIFGVTQVIDSDWVELTSYQLKDVAHIWFTHRKYNMGHFILTLCIEINFVVSPETLLKPLLVSTPVGDPFIARLRY